ncbi:MAG: hypothetical protein ACHQWH_03965 [Nitrososphaerales archaeon]
MAQVLYDLYSRTLLVVSNVCVDEWRELDMKTQEEWDTLAQTLMTQGWTGND